MPWSQYFFTTTASVYYNTDKLRGLQTDCQLLKQTDPRLYKDGPVKPGNLAVSKKTVLKKTNPVL